MQILFVEKYESTVDIVCVLCFSDNTAKCFANLDREDVLQNNSWAIFFATYFCMKYL